MRDIRTGTWIELVEALYDFPKDFHQRHRSQLVYRGLGYQAHALETGLQRLGADYARIEAPMLRTFRRYSGPGSIPGNSVWDLLSVAQHHGLPTRLLDWTISPKVAIHFATAQEKHYDKDGVVWCVDIVRAKELLPQGLRRVLEHESAFMFSVEMLQLIPSLTDFDKLGEGGPFVLFFEPPSLDTRIINQAAVMAAMPGATQSFAEFLKQHPSLCHRIIIPKELKWEVRDKLDQDNVTERMLFPGLDGLSRWLKRYYGPGPVGPRGACDDED